MIGAGPAGSAAGYWLARHGLDVVMVDKCAQSPITYKWWYATPELAPLGDPFRPYRSMVAWYCWRVVDTPTP